MSGQNISKRTIDDHLEGVPLVIVDLFKKLHEQILELNQVKAHSKGQYIGYYFVSGRENLKLFVELHIQKRNKRIVLHLRPCEYNDPHNKVFPYKYIPKWPLRSGLIVVDEQDLNYSIPLIKVSYKDIS